MRPRGSLNPAVPRPPLVEVVHIPARRPQHLSIVDKYSVLHGTPLRSARCCKPLLPHCCGIEACSRCHCMFSRQHAAIRVGASAGVWHAILPYPEICAISRQQSCVPCGHAWPGAVPSWVLSIWGRYALARCKLDRQHSMLGHDPCEVVREEPQILLCIQISHCRLQPHRISSGLVGIWIAAGSCQHTGPSLELAAEYHHTGFRPNPNMVLLQYGAVRA